MGETCVIQVTHQSGATIEYSPVEALKRVCDIFSHSTNFRELTFATYMADRRIFGNNCWSWGADGIEFLSLVLFVMKWTECTLNSAYHSVKDSWACPCYIAYLVVPTHLCCHYKCDKLHPTWPDKSHQNHIWSSKLIRWMTMRTWSQFRMQSLGWWDIFTSRPIAKCHQPSNLGQLECSTFAKLNLVPWIMAHDQI